MNKTYIYVVDRDFGFAPNPFHGVCTLATCKPKIRGVAKVNDWVIGMGGGRLKSTGKCVYAMRVMEKITFDQYWLDPRFQEKKPVRNGSGKMLIGDNIYRTVHKLWVQSDSHHSNADGTPNVKNLTTDTSRNSVLISTDFYYFGAAALEVPQQILDNMRYKNVRDHRTFKTYEIQPLINWLRSNFVRNRLVSDPFDFTTASARYTGEGSKIITV